MKKMFNFKWDPEYLSIHVESMDNDHQKLIEIMNEIYTLHTKNASRDRIHLSLKKLGSFVGEHFRREEQYFDSLKNYPDAEIHKAIHSKLVQKYTQHLKSFESGKNLDDSFFFFLKAWLVAHIEGVDAKYGMVAQKKAA